MLVCIFFFFVLDIWILNVLAQTDPERSQRFLTNKHNKRVKTHTDKEAVWRLHLLKVENSWIYYIFQSWNGKVSTQKKQNKKMKTNPDGLINVRSCLSRGAAPSHLQECYSMTPGNSSVTLGFLIMMLQPSDPEPSYIFSKWPACITEYLSFCPKACGRPEKNVLEEKSVSLCESKTLFLHKMVMTVHSMLVD